MGVVVLLLLLSFGTHLVYSGNHILHYYFTAVVSDVTHGLPQYSVVGYVDNLFFGRYSSDTRHPELLIPSLKGLNDLIKELTINAHDKENADIIMMKLIMSSLNKTGDGAFHVFQIKYSCELREDGGIHGNEDFAFDAKEFMTFDTENPQYLPLVQEALIVTQKWNGIFAKLKTVYMENVCISHLKFYLSHLKKDLEKKVSPKVKVSSSESESGIKLHCRVYGFYPRDVEVKWIKNGRDEIYSEESAEILPNPDGTYQIRVSVEVTPEEGATYSCHVDHSSLENPLVTPFEANNGKLLYILIAVGVTIILFAVVLGVFIYRKKSGIKWSRTAGEEERTNGHGPSCNRWRCCPRDKRRMGIVVFLLLSCGAHLASCGSHIFQYSTTLVSDPKQGLSKYSVVAYLDNLMLGTYNSDKLGPEPLTPSHSSFELYDDIEELTKIIYLKESLDKMMMKLITSSLNKTGVEDFHVMQIKNGCELSEDGSIRGNEELAFDAKDYITFDTANPEYIPVVPGALIAVQKRKELYSKLQRTYVENVCISQLKLHLPYLKNVLEKKVPPKVKISSSESESGTKLHCWVYGFYPRDVEVKWIKNGRDEIYSEESAEILPNPDGTYQIRVSVEVTPEEGATYSCHVDHSSLENPLVVPFETNNDGKLLYILIAVSVTVVLFVFLGIFRYRKRSDHQPVTTEERERD
ncbi:uncharacterized protein LOC108699401 isoform X2 [Xenopus laevis]|uniref:Uncharacterized protein LOC108699401 isoform X2 n=2 Tax=Xenopus laevis TaxID=8355 RepID=A0A8J0TDU7_XENLA|nr:uncharacterized protein LOC108699401 isoform X2 [Xenopus laevis]